MIITPYSLHLSAESVCTQCVCFYCYNPDCPHLTRQSVRVSEWKTHRCYKCGIMWQNKKPLDYCDFYVSCQKPRPKIYTVIRKYRNKTQLQKLCDKIDRLEKLVEKMYNENIEEN